MVYHPPESQFNWDKWGPLCLILGAIIFLASGCSVIRKNQIQKDGLIVDHILRDYRWSLRNEFDRNNMDQIRFKVRKQLNEQLSSNP